MNLKLASTKDITTTVIHLVFYGVMWMSLQFPDSVWEYALIVFVWVLIVGQSIAIISILKTGKYRSKTENTIYKTIIVWCLPVVTTVYLVWLGYLVTALLYLFTVLCMFSLIGYTNWRGK